MTALHVEVANERDLTLTNFGVQVFRGIKNIDIKELGRFNVLVGSGNSGKTSILEALAIFCNPQNVPAWLGIARTREIRASMMFFDQAQSSNLEMLSWLFPHRGGEGEAGIENSIISMRADGKNPVRELAARASTLRGTTARTRYVEDADGNEREVTEEVEDFGLLVNVNVSYESGELPFGDPLSHSEIEIPFWRHAGFATRRQIQSKHRIACEFLAPYSHRSQPSQLRGLSKAVIDDEKASISNLIRDLDPCVRDVEIISDKEGSRPVIALRHCFTGLAPLHVFGDGLRRALTIALAIHQARNGLLLIDEIEAALHISALDRVFPWVMRACREYDVQLFATTHSLEAVSAISQASDSDAPSSVVAYHLGGEGQTVKRYNSSMLRRLVHERGLDIR